MTDYVKIAALAILLIADIATVTAQERSLIDRDLRVQDRARPDYDAIGAPVGRFLLFPEATLDVIYDDNILAADEPAPGEEDLVISDTLVLLAPALELKSDWSRNSLNAGGRAISGRYNDNASQDFTDYELWVNGDYEFGPNQLRAEARHAYLHELRTSANDSAFQPGDESASPPTEDRLGRPLFPTEYTRDDIEVGYRYAPNRIYADATVGFRNYDFDSAIAIDRCVVFDSCEEAGIDNPIFVVENDDRDRLNSQFKLRLGYQFSPSSSVFLESRLYDIDYDTAKDRFGNNLDQDGYDIVGGSDFDLTGVISGDFFVGYRNIDYADANFQTQNGPVYGGSIGWNITQLTTITFTGSKNLYGNTIANSSGTEAAALGLRVDHELRRNFVLRLNLQSINEDFLQTGREDDLLGVRLGAEYLLSRNWSLNGGYVYEERESNSVGSRQFKVNQFYLGIRGQI